jgi:apolipoprotein N-acyltransferase
VRAAGVRAGAGPLGLAAVGGALLCAGFVGFGVWPLALLALPPLWEALEREPSRPLLGPALAGLAFGWVAYAGGYAWLWRLVDVFLAGDVRLGAALWSLHSLWWALRFALYATLYVALRRRGWPVAAAGVAPLVAIEWLYPSLFPFYLGSSFVDRTPWIQLVDLGGPLAASALAALASAAAFESWRWLRGRRPRPAWTWAVAGLALALAWGYGTLRVRALEGSITAAPALRVGLVQANLGVHAKRDRPELVHRRYLEQTRRLLAGGDLDLVVWPETVYVRGLQRPLPISGELIREDLRVPILFGAATVRVAGGRSRRYNSALLIGADGVIRDAYDKNWLIPFAEYLPLAGVAAPLARLFPNAQQFAAASDTPPLTLGPWRLSTPICYEAVRPDFVRRMFERARPQLFVSLANDAWFGDSQEPWIHLAMARLRAVELHRYLVRATNSGVSAVVDPMGRVVARTRLLVRESLRAQVRLLEGRSLYARLGDWPGWLAAAGVGLGLALPDARRRAGRRRPPGA